MARRAPRCSKNIAKRGAVAKNRMTGDKQSFIETLKNNRSFCSIVNAVALSERCSFFLLSSKTPLSTNAALEYLKTSVEGLTGEEIELVLYRPKYGSGYKEMIEDTIRPLLDRDMGSFGHTLYAIDFTSFADTPNETVVVFQRLNELRNAIVDRLDGSLVVIAPFGMEREFALRAPDMWSIRSGVCMMEAALVENVDMPTYAESPKAQTTLRYAKNDVTELSEEVARLRELYRGSPDNYAIAMGLLVAFDRYGKYIMEYGSIDDALRLYEEAYEITKQIHAANPTSLEAARDLSVGYDKIGDIYLKTGDIQKAKTAYEESLEIAKQIRAANPTSLEAARDLSVSYNKIGDIYLKTGDIQKAKITYEVSLGIDKLIYAANPTSLEAARDLSISYEKKGDIYLKTGDMQKAKTAYEESLEIRKQIRAANPTSLEAARDLSISYEKKGNIYLKTGDIQKAKTAYEESLEIAKQIHAANPTSLEAVRDLSVSYIKLAQVYESMGDDRAALRYWSDCKALLEPLAKRVGDVDGIVSILEICKTSIDRLI